MLAFISGLVPLFTIQAIPQARISLPQKPEASIDRVLEVLVDETELDQSGMASFRVLAGRVVELSNNEVSYAVLYFTGRIHAAEGSDEFETETRRFQTMTLNLNCDNKGAHKTVAEIFRNGKSGAVFETYNCRSRRVSLWFDSNQNGTLDEGDEQLLNMPAFDGVLSLDAGT